MDFISFAKVAVQGVPLLFVIMGVVEWFKRFKKADGSPRFEGNTILIISMVWGLIIGSGYMVTVTRPPAGDWWTVYVYWFGVIVYGIAMGLIASGLYDVIKNIIDKIVSTQINQLTGTGGQK